MVRTVRALEIGQPLDVVDDLVAVEVVEEAVDGEVAAARVLLGGAEDVVAADVELVVAVALLGVEQLVVVVVFDLARVGAEGRRSR